VFESVTSLALSSALDGLSMRQRAIANNIANVNTPNYKAQRVQFEDALAKSVQQGDGAVAATIAESLEPTGSTATTSTSTPRPSPMSTPCCATSSRRAPSRASSAVSAPH
jgi:flagellar basal-body rod protein FlgB